MEAFPIILLEDSENSLKLEGIVTKVGKIQDLNRFMIHVEIDQAPQEVPIQV